MIQFITQPSQNEKYTILLETAFKIGKFSQIKSAFAYSTYKGAKTFEDTLNRVNPSEWTKLKKKWLIGIDWCRSEPTALKFLSNLSNSELRIPFGLELIKRNNCTPRITFHPKTIILRGNNSLAVISGSGNLSLNGLTRGYECGNLILVNKPNNENEKIIWNSLDKVDKWFDLVWKFSSTLKSIFKEYLNVYNSIPNFHFIAPTDDDAAKTNSINYKSNQKILIDPQRLILLRKASKLWIYAGNLHKNRGKNKPGNQLMLSPFTRIFFGFEAIDELPDTLIGYVKIEYNNKIRIDCSLRFSNNSMDVLTLPVPVCEGPESYDKKYLLFEKVGNGFFRLSLSSKTDYKKWEKTSKIKNSLYTMTSGRPWGVF